MIVKLIPKLTHRLYSLREHSVELYKGLTLNPQWLFMRYLCSFTFIRTLFNSWRQFSYSPSKSITQTQTLFSESSIEQVVTSLTTQGISLGINLPANLRQEILDFALNSPCYGNRKAQQGFYYGQKEYLPDHIYNKTFLPETILIQV
ncbi:MAG: hypothetical protein WA865_06820 [Spirulinaceae cyanobacterium]